MGTPDYMAPEQVKGKRGDARTDIYSLGAILYEMVTGQPPFEGTNPLAIMNARLIGDPIAPRKLNPNISPQVEEIILHAMEQRPENRYPSAAAMKADLEAPEKVMLTGRADRLRPPAQWTDPGGRRKSRSIRPDPDHPLRTDLSDRPPARRTVADGARVSSSRVADPYGSANQASALSQLEF